MTWLSCLLLAWGCSGSADAPQDTVGQSAQPAATAASDAARIEFVDVTEASGVDFVLHAGAIPPTQILEVKGGGLAVFDWNADGEFDLFLPGGATLEDPERGQGARLFAGEAGLVFRDATSEAGLDWAGWGMGSAAGDVDGDGRSDLFVACFGADALLLNRPGGFEHDADSVLAAGPDWSANGAFGDLDRDGDLDLFVACYLEFDPAAPPPPTRFLGVEVFGGPAGLAALPDRVFENLGQGQFADRSTALAGTAAAHGLGCLIFDLDQDGHQDVYVANDSMPNHLFLGSEVPFEFEESAQRLGLARNGDGQAQATMGLALADVNDDGRPDLFSTNFARDTNTLWTSRGEALWRDETRRFGLAAASREPVGWATLFCDFDLDGDEDLFCVNGHVYPDDVAQRLDSHRAQAPLLYLRDGERFRVQPALEGEALARAGCDRGAVSADLDGDGDDDLVLVELGGPVRVLENRTGGRSLGVRLRWTDVGNGQGLGATLTLRGAGPPQRRFLAGGQGYQSSAPAVARFALPAEGEADGLRLEVCWPDGRLDELELAAETGERTVERALEEGREQVRFR